MTFKVSPLLGNKCHKETVLALRDSGSPTLKCSRLSRARTYNITVMSGTFQPIKL